MKRPFQFTCFALLAAVAFTTAGCAVRDGHEGQPAPIWWPTFLYRPATQPTTQQYDQANGAAIDLPAQSANVQSANAQSADAPAAAVQRDIRGEWNPDYDLRPVSLAVSGESPAGAAPAESAGAGSAGAGSAGAESAAAELAGATLYPNRGEAALAAGSATLYPPTNEFNGGPARTASVFPRGPLAPTGYVGR